MRRSELLEAASLISGRKASYSHLWYATRLGHVDNATVVCGWKDYTEQHVTQLVEYLKKNARPQRREVSK